MRVLIAMLFLVSAVGCGASSMPAIGNALVNTGIAASVSAAQRANGGCYATCGHGRVCNPDTGYCESRPCRFGCGVGQYCDDAKQREPMCADGAPPAPIVPTPPAPSTPPPT